MSDPSSTEEISVSNERSLNTLARAIRMSVGQFSLILARCNYASLRAEIVQRLKQRCPVELRELYLTASVKTLYTTIQAELGNQYPEALMVFGLEWVTAIDQVLISTNQIREEFRKNYQFPLVLWVNDDILQKLIQLAPDFKSWAATSIKFEIATDDLILNLQQTADAVFAAILNLGANRFLDDTSLNQTLHSSPASHSLELEFAAKDLQNLGVALPPILAASLQFLRGRSAAASGDKLKARQLYEQSLQYWQESHWQESHWQESSANGQQHHQNGQPTSASSLERHGCVLFYLGLWWRQYATLHRAEYQAACLKARDCYRQCVEGFLQGDRPELAARFINVWGEVLTRLGDTEELATVAELAVKLHQVHSGPLRLAYGYGLRAEVALHRSDWDRARRFAELALTTNDQPTLSEANWEWDRQYYHNLYLLLLAQAEQRLHQPLEAIAHLEVARTESDPQFDPLLYVRILETLRSLYFEQGDYRKAFQIKRDQRSIEQQYGLRAFIGAGRLQPTRQVLNLSLALYDRQASVAQEISASVRQQDVNRLVERMTRPDRKLSVIYGQSGVGKSSIMRAGLVPALQQLTIEARDILPVLLDVYTDWDGALRRKLENPVTPLPQLWEEPDSQELLEIVKREIASPKAFASETESKGKTVEFNPILEQLQHNIDHNLLTVLIFDQFEEFFFVCKDRSKRLVFYDFLSQCLNLPFVKVILSLREDYLHFLLEFNRLGSLEVIQNNILDREILYYLGNFLPADAKAVIQSLTQRSQVYLEPILIDQLVQDLALDTGEVRPIELQIVGAQLETEKITTLTDYQQQGTKDKLVARFLEGVIQDCGKENEKVARLVLYLLTDENGTRPLKTRAELATELASDTEKLDLILEILVSSGLVFLLPEVPADRYQLVHDYLVLFIRQQQGLGLLAELETLRQQERLSQAEIERLRKEKELLAELAEAKAKQQKSEARLNRFLWVGATVGLAVIASAAFSAIRVAQAESSKAKSERRNAIISQIGAMSTSSELTLPTDQLGALLSSVQLGKQLEATEVFPEDVRLRGMNILQRTVYGVQERNRLNYSDQVLSVSFSPDGKNLASGTQTGKIQLWTAAGKLLKSPTAHNGMVGSVAFSPDSKWLVSAGQDATIKLWNLEGTLVKTFKGHTKEVSSISFSPDGQRLASGSLDGTVKIWDRNGRVLRTLDGQGGVESVAFSPDGQLLTAASRSGLILLWASDGRWLATLSGHNAPVYSVSFSPDSKTIISASKDKTLRLWNTNGRRLANFVGHDDEVMAARFSPDGKTIVSAGLDRTIKLWSLDGRLLRTLTGHRDSINDVVFRPDGKVIASASRDKTVRIWSTTGGMLRQTILGHSGTVRGVQVSPDGKMLASAGEDQTVKLWSTDGKLLNTLRGHTGPVLSVAINPQGSLIASASSDQTVRIWSKSGTMLKTLAGHRNEVHSVQFSPDGKQLLSASLDGTARLWKLQGQLIRQFAIKSTGIYDAVFSPDGKRIAAASNDKLVRIWSVNGGSLLQTLKGHNDEVNSIAFGRDGTLVSASRDRTVRQWQVSTGELIGKPLEGHSYAVEDAVFSPDGKLVASASDDQTIKLWDAADGTLLKTLAGHTNWVYGISFSPDGRSLASASKDGTIRVWDTETLDFKGLLDRGCDLLQDYLKNNPNLKNEERFACSVDSNRVPK